MPPAGLRIAVVAGAADYMGGAVTPGGAIVAFGSEFGPAQLATLALDAQGRVTTTLAEARMLFDGVPAPMIYAVAGQLSAFVPFAVAGRAATEMRIEYRGVLSPPLMLRVLVSMPALFTADASGGGPGAILNQDGTPNSETNPTNPGDAVVLFGTGGGQTDPPGVDGRLAGSPLPKLTQDVRVLIDGLEATIEYVGPAPGLVEGVL